MRFRSLSLVIALLATPFAAEAQPFQGLYVGAGAGYNLPQNIPLAVGAAVGAAWWVRRARQRRLRAGQRVPLRTGRQLPSGSSWQHDELPSATSGSVQTYGVMANALFDIDVGAPWIYPYIGGGVGYAWTHLSQSASSRQPASR